MQKKKKRKTTQKKYSDKSIKPGKTFTKSESLTRKQRHAMMKNKYFLHACFYVLQFNK